MAKPVLPTGGDDNGDGLVDHNINGPNHRLHSHNNDHSNHNRLHLNNNYCNNHYVDNDLNSDHDQHDERWLYRNNSHP